MYFLIMKGGLKMENEIFEGVLDKDKKFKQKPQEWTKEASYNVVYSLMKSARLLVEILDELKRKK